MLYNIIHQTIYTYNQPVWLKPHHIRLQPRSDSWQKVHSFSLSVTPKPEQISSLLDLDGNNLTKIWFTQATEKLILKIMTQVETFKENPFDYLLEPWAVKLPLDYPHSLYKQLQPYLQPYNNIFDPIAIEIAQEINLAVHGNITAFLATLNQRLYENCNYITREKGEPLPPGVTWKQKQGSCRDLAVLFMEVCQVMGLGARFVSGYQEGDPDQENRDLHAWVEVYLPGGGWRGYDPTHGLAVSDRHIALCASAIPAYAAPIVGHITPVKSITEGGQVTQAKIAAQISLQAMSKK